MARKQRIEAYVDPDKAVAVEQRADERGQSVSEFIREAINRELQRGQADA